MSVEVGKNGSLVFAYIGF